MKRFLLLLLFLPFLIKAQFTGQVGQAGCDAIYKDSSIIIAWAKKCRINRGWQDISNPILKTTVGDSSSAIGVADGLNVISLGDGGEAILQFDLPIINGTGADFCVFENAIPGFLELAFVEVSSDGLNFFRFPATSNTQTLTQIGAFDATGNATLLNNLAGKHLANYGTPFDLQELQNINGLNINAITHVKVIDVVGSVTQIYATKDKNNNTINDPWNTPFASGGFDLDAVGVIHQQPLGINKINSIEGLITAYPNPANEFIQIKFNALPEFIDVTITNNTGEIMLQKLHVLNETIPVSCLSSGLYFLKVTTIKHSITKKIMVNH
jgi:Secretion system C-terminal sorting domain